MNKFYWGCLIVIFIGVMYTFSVYIPALAELNSKEAKQVILVHHVPKTASIDLGHVTVPHKKHTPVKHKDNHGNFAGGYMYAKEQE